MKRASYSLIFVTRENEIFMSVWSVILFDRAEDPVLVSKIMQS